MICCWYKSNIPGVPKKSLRNLKFKSIDVCSPNSQILLDRTSDYIFTLWWTFSAWTDYFEISNQWTFIETWSIKPAKKPLCDVRICNEFSKHKWVSWFANQTWKLIFENISLQLDNAFRPKKCVFRVTRPCLNFFIQISPTLIFYSYFLMKKHNFMKYKNICTKTLF